MEELKKHIRDVPDFPKPGILFRDITTLLKNPGAFRAAVDGMVGHYRDEQFDALVAIESRGFILASAMAYLLETALVPVRKPGKLPAATYRQEYSLEYGIDALEMHTDAVSKGQRILVVDDLLATGGTAAATVALARQTGAEVLGCAFLIELSDLSGRDRLGGVPVFSLIRY